MCCSVVGAAAHLAGALGGKAGAAQVVTVQIAKDGSKRWVGETSAE